MRLRYVAAIGVLSFVVGVAGAQSAPNWLAEVLMVRSAQTQVARHPIDRGRYYLCWTEGSKRFGMWFRQGSLETKLRGIRPGQRIPMSKMLSATGTTWTASDEKFCFGG